MSCVDKTRFTISPGIARVIEAFDKGQVDSLVPEMGATAVNLLKRWWPKGRMTAVRFTGDIWGPADEHTILMQAEKANFDRGKSVLDIACGIGGPGRILAKHYGCSVTGVDINGEAIELARGLTRLEGLANLVSYQVADKDLLPYADRSFDIVWGRGGWGSGEDEGRQTWREAVRVLKAEGQVIATSGVDRLPFLVELGFAQVTFFSYYREEWRKNLTKFLRAMEENRDEIVSRTSQQNYDEWYDEKSQQLEYAMQPNCPVGVILGVK